MNKEQYRKNRAAGKRGQGDYPNPIVKSYTPEEWDKYCSRTTKAERRGRA